MYMSRTNELDNGLVVLALTALVSSDIYIYILVSPVSLHDSATYSEFTLLDILPLSFLLCPPMDTGLNQSGLFQLDP